MKYFFFDIDGTLTSSKEYGKIPSSTMQAILALQNTEHFVALATGRAHCLASEFAQKINIVNYVCEGGNCLVKNNEEIFYEFPNRAEMNSLIAQCEDLEIPYALSINDNKIGYSKWQNFKTMIGNGCAIMQEVVYVPGLDYQDKDIRRVFLYNDKEKIARLNGFEELCLMGYEWSPFRLIEPDDKYKGIAKLVEMIGGNQQDIVVFGDGVNDIKMFEKAPFKIAMGNACEPLKQMSDYITHDSATDGIEHALKHFGWIK